MIIVTKLDGNSALLNTDNVKYIEQNADTIVHYINGDTMMVRETIDELKEKMVEYHKDIIKEPSR